MSTATGEHTDVPTGILLACVISAVIGAVGVFITTTDIALSIVAYIVIACFSYALSWVIQ